MGAALQPSHQWPTLGGSASSFSEPVLHLLQSWACAPVRRTPSTQLSEFEPPSISLTSVSITRQQPPRRPHPRGRPAPKSICSSMRENGPTDRCHRHRHASPNSGCTEKTTYGASVIFDDPHHLSLSHLKARLQKEVRRAVRSGHLSDVEGSRCVGRASASVPHLFKPVGASGPEAVTQKMCRFVRCSVSAHPQFSPLTPLTCHSGSVPFDIIGRISVLKWATSKRNWQKMPTMCSRSPENDSEEFFPTNSRYFIAQLVRRKNMPTAHHQVPCESPCFNFCTHTIRRGLARHDVFPSSPMPRFG